MEAAPQQVRPPLHAPDLQLFPLMSQSQPTPPQLVPPTSDLHPPAPPLQAPWEAASPACSPQAQDHPRMLLQELVEAGWRSHLWEQVSGEGEVWGVSPGCCYPGGMG